MQLTTECPQHLPYRAHRNDNKSVCVVQPSELYCEEDLSGLVQVLRLKLNRAGKQTKKHTKHC